MEDFQAAEEVTAGSATGGLHRESPRSGCAAAAQGVCRQSGCVRARSAAVTGAGWRRPPGPASLGRCHPTRGAAHGRAPSAAARIHLSSGRDPAARDVFPLRPGWGHRAAPAGTRSMPA